jgi:alpha-methylacyl-CoA racemase
MSVAGPLAGHVIVEMAGLGPAPLACLMLAEMGARVIRIERKGAGRAFLSSPVERDLDRHGRDVIEVDLKNAEGKAFVLGLLGKADVLVEGFRPGVMERLGLGPDDVAAACPRLVYARMTGLGQDGPLKDRAGHDLTYLALTGGLHAIGPADGKPVVPLNLVADYGGGTMFLIAGILAALVERGRSGRGQVVDATMIDGVSMLLAPTYAYLANGFWQDRRGENLLDGGAPFYDTYETSDGRHVAVACLEPQFFAEFAKLLPLPDDLAGRQYDRAIWPELRLAIEARFRQRPRDEWAALFEPSDACVAPVLTLAEAAAHPHNLARRTHSDDGPMLRPMPAPRFSRTASELAGPKHGVPDLTELGVTQAEREALVAAGIIGFRETRDG